MSGKLIIQGKAWGEFESAKRSKGNIEISGYRSYGGRHTVRMVDQPQLNENQQIVLEWLKEEHFDSYVKSVLSNLYFYINMTAIGDLDNKRIQEMVNAYEKLSQGEFAQVLELFSKWALEQEEE